MGNSGFAPFSGGLAAPSFRRLAAIPGPREAEGRTMDSPRCDAHTARRRERGQDGTLADARPAGGRGPCPAGGRMARRVASRGVLRRSAVGLRARGNRSGPQAGPVAGTRSRGQGGQARPDPRRDRHGAGLSTSVLAFGRRVRCGRRPGQRDRAGRQAPPRRAHAGAGWAQPAQWTRWPGRRGLLRLAGGRASQPPRPLRGGDPCRRRPASRPGSSWPDGTPPPRCCAV